MYNRGLKSTFSHEFDVNIYFLLFNALHYSSSDGSISLPFDSMSMFFLLSISIRFRFFLNFPSIRCRCLKGLIFDSIRLIDIESNRVACFDNRLITIKQHIVVTRTSVFLTYKKITNIKSKLRLQPLFSQVLLNLFITPYDFSVAVADWLACRLVSQLFLGSNTSGKS